MSIASYVTSQDIHHFSLKKTEVVNVVSFSSLCSKVAGAYLSLLGGLSTMATSDEDTTLFITYSMPGNLIFQFYPFWKFQTWKKRGGSDEYTPIFVTSARFHKQWKKWWISLLSIILIIRRLSQTMEEVMDLLVFHQSDHYGGSPLPDRTGLPKNRQKWLSQSINGKTRQSF